MESGFRNETSRCLILPRRRRGRKSQQKADSVSQSQAISWGFLMLDIYLIRWMLFFPNRSGFSHRGDEESFSSHSAVDFEDNVFVREGFKISKENNISIFCCCCFLITLKAFNDIEKLIKYLN